VADHYADGTYRWWHLSQPPPDLLAALSDGWLPSKGRVLDVGCGLGTETGHLAAAGWQAAGIDLSETALVRAAAAHPRGSFLRTDVRLLPFADHSFDAAVDRGCFHYLAPADRPRYGQELRRVLAPGGRLLLRASLRTAGIRNDIDAEVIKRTFEGWQMDSLEEAAVPSDTRLLEVLVARLIRPDTPSA
jgi:SAM-dependent methyltransferase